MDDDDDILFDDLDRDEIAQEGKRFAGYQEASSSMSSYGDEEQDIPNELAKPRKLSNKRRRRK